jgi:hypothetical protein
MSPDFRYAKDYTALAAKGPDANQHILAAGRKNRIK